MKIFLLMLLGCCLGSSAVAQQFSFPRFESPKGAEASASQGSPMAKAAVAPAPKTNVFRLKFAWNYTNSADGFILKYGQKSGQWTNSIATGPTNSYNLRLTNWAECSLRHFYIVAARVGSLTSTPSNECFYPPYPASDLILQWGTNWPAVTVLHSTNLLIPRAAWQPVGVVTNGRCWQTNLLDGQHFFVINQADTVTIRLFNPMNLGMGQNLCATNYVAPPSASTLSNGLLAFFKLDETQDTRLDTVSSQHLTENFATVGALTGKIGLAADGAGLTALVSTNPIYDLAGNTRSISIWAKATGASDDIICGRWTGVIDDSSWRLTTGHNNKFSVQTVDTQPSSTFNDTAVTVDTNWHHFVITWNGLDELAIWVDGVQSGGGGSEIQSGQVGLNFTLLNSENTGSQPFDGLVDLLGIWDRVLTAGEIGQLYNAGAGRQPPF